MANNYTTSTPTTLEFGGDNVGAGTIPLQYNITITPNNGHFVQATDFSVGSALPIEVTTVSFADTTTPYAAGNLVVATVTLAQWYTMPGVPDTIEIDIDGRTIDKPQPRLSFTAVNNVIGESTDGFSIASSTSPQMLNRATISDTTASNIKTHAVGGDIPTNTKVFVGSFTFAGAPNNVGFFNAEPTYKIISKNPSRWSSKVAFVRYGDYAGSLTDNNFVSGESGEIVLYQLDFYYEMGDDVVPLSAGESIVFNCPTETLWSTLEPVISIDKASFNGFKNQGILPSRDTNLTLSVSGSSGATYNILIIDSNGLSYDFALNAFTRSLTKSSEQTINTNPPVGEVVRFNNHKIKVAAYSEKRALNKQLTTTITPTGATKTTADGTSSDPHVITLNQFGEVDFEISITAATDGVAATTPSVLSYINKKPLSYPTVFKPTDFPLLSTTNNSYFNISTPLSYSVTDTVDTAFSGTAMVVDTSHVTKKVVIGDTVSGTNITAGTTITAVNVGDNVKAYTLSTAPSAEVADAATITFTRNVGISRQPLESDIISSIDTTSQIEYEVTQQTTNSITVRVTDDSDDYSLIKAGQTVQGDSIIGYPTVLTSGSKDIVFANNSFQSLLSGDTLTFSNAMSSYYIADINVSGAGTSNCKLNVEGYANRVGLANVQENIVLQNFITSYVAPVATALAVDCPLGGSVKVFPIGVSHTGKLIIATAPKGSTAGTGDVSDDGSYLIYRAPDTDGDFTDTITYTVSDGINTSPTANIVVTLIQ